MILVIDSTAHYFQHDTILIANKFLNFCHVIYLGQSCLCAAKFSFNRSKCGEHLESIFNRQRYIVFRQKNKGTRIPVNDHGYVHWFKRNENNMLSSIIEQTNTNLKQS